MAEYKQPMMILDGVEIHVEQVYQMAIKCNNAIIAEHYKSQLSTWGWYTDDKAVGRLCLAIAQKYGMPPFQKQEPTDSPSVAPIPKRTKKQHTEAEIIEILKKAIKKLMDEQNGTRGGYLFRFSKDWIAIYRVIADYNLGISNGDYTGFDGLASKIQPEGCRVEYSSKSSLTDISKFGYDKPFLKWKYDPIYMKTRAPYDHMCKIVNRLIEILKELELIYE